MRRCSSPRRGRRVRRGEVLDLAVVERPRGQHRASQDGAAVERRLEQQGLVHQAREFDGANGVNGLDVDEGIEA